MKRRALVFSILFACACGALFAGALNAPAAGARFPAPVGYVNDFAGVIPEEDRARITAIATELEQKTGAELAVATVATTGGEDIQDYSVGMYMQWGIGKKGKDNGVLIVAAINDRQLWIKPGYGLEGTITDAFSHEVYSRIMRPAFRQGEYGKGFVTAVEVVATAVADAEGVTLTTIGKRPQVPRGDTGGGLTVVGMIVVIAVLMLFLFFVGTARRASGKRIGGFPFWTGGGFSGGLSGGSFGGGFGGFGGGSCGGGGAGGGW